MLFLGLNGCGMCVGIMCTLDLGSRLGLRLTKNPMPFLRSNREYCIAEILHSTSIVLSPVLPSWKSGESKNLLSRLIFSTLGTCLGS